MTIRDSVRLHNLEKRIKNSYWVDPETNCWIGKTELLNNGYHRICIYKKERVMLHRLMYEKYKGKIPFMMEVDHLCKNKRCCNPAHLELVTRIENTLRSNLTKLSQKEIKDIELAVNNGKSQTEVARIFNINQCHVSRIVNGERRKYIR